MKEPPELPLRESTVRSIPWLGMAIFLLFGLFGILFMIFFSCLIVKNGDADSVEKVTLFSVAPWVGMIAGGIPLIAGIIGGIVGLIRRPVGYWWKALVSMIFAYIAGIGFTIAIASNFF